ncbi:Ubiquitin domain-containing protein 2 [Clydaea vesicula]|uniref:Ubiquitin domain-containing protein 2 n=1 Tax=Clydaea vesicula TaxID=447962 RepID=A0AAD5Y027_9FUNG|nr:Ubiquitin domain-containing protein 2 [Clydaea vesicula]
MGNSSSRNRDRASGARREQRSGNRNSSAIRSSSQPPIVQTGEPKPLIPQKDIVWTHTNKITLEELTSMRQKACCEAISTLETAQAIIDASNIICPSGNLVDGCYDEFGNHYVIPQFCISEPTNLAKHRSGLEERKREETLVHSTAALTMLNPTAKKGVDDNDSNNLITGCVPITARLSTGKDLKITVDPDNNILSIRKQLLDNSEFKDNKKVNLKLIHFGRILDDNIKIKNTKISAGSVIQIMVQEK